MLLPVSFSVRLFASAMLHCLVPGAPESSFSYRAIHFQSLCIRQRPACFETTRFVRFSFLLPSRTRLIVPRPPQCASGKIRGVPPAGKTVLLPCFSHSRARLRIRYSSFRHPVFSFPCKVHPIHSDRSVFQGTGRSPAGGCHRAPERIRDRYFHANFRFPLRCSGPSSSSSSCFRTWHPYGIQGRNW